MYYLKPKFVNIDQNAKSRYRPGSDMCERTFIRDARQRVFKQHVNKINDKHTTHTHVHVHTFHRYHTTTTFLQRASCPHHNHYRRVKTITVFIKSCL